MPVQTRKRKAPSPASAPDEPPAKKQSKQQSKPAASQKNDTTPNNASAPQRTQADDDNPANPIDYQTFTIPGPSDKAKPIPCESRDTGFSLDETLIFTHGAGGGLSNPATKLFAEGYVSRGEESESSIVCFQGTMNLPSRVKAFEAVFQHLVEQDPKRTFAVGGRSMGARAAVMIASNHDEIKRLVLVSYPLTSPKGEMRDGILLELPAEKEVLFISGRNDEMCDLGELKRVMKKMEARTKLVVVEDADHGMSLGLAGLGLKKEKKDEVIERVRRETGRVAAQWVEDTENFGGGWRIEYDAVNDRFVLGGKNATDDESREVSMAESIGADEVAGADAEEVEGEDAGEKKVEEEAHEKATRTGTQKVRRKRGKPAKPKDANSANQKQPPTAQAEK
ncbi:hypothetical protein OHC33_009377 [Knufia fluminis]|uniref:KANL3/Tex30 alpha/beta hydrolase-like domain-containing protein n=1 Tax=Knufia fluminis TaxID=191047 RepID=A0AAN8EAW7_9EURO|nr:hypothetical protein OHC33_009377 [Knufia fluminis]